MDKKLSILFCLSLGYAIRGQSLPGKGPHNLLYWDGCLYDLISKRGPSTTYVLQENGHMSENLTTATGHRKESILLAACGAQVIVSCLKRVVATLVARWTWFRTSLVNLSRELIEGLNQVPNTRAFLITTPLPCPLKEAYPSFLIANTHEPKLLRSIHVFLAIKPRSLTKS